MKTKKHYLSPDVSVEEFKAGLVICLSTDSSSNLDNLQEEVIWSE